MKFSKPILLPEEKKGLKKLVFVHLWFVTKYVVSLLDLVVELYCKSKRSMQYAKIGWNNRDFDSAFVFPLLLFKLKRVYKNTIDEGVHVVSKEEKQSLRICIKLLDRLCNRNYGETFSKEHDKKWGELNFSRTPRDFDDKGNPITYNFNSYRPGIKTTEDEVQEREETKNLFKLEHELYHQDLEKFWRIFAKYHEYWWD